MNNIKTYTAVIKVTFDVNEGEKPRLIARQIADSFNGMRGANLYTYGEIEKLTEKINP